MSPPSPGGIVALRLLPAKSTKKPGQHLSDFLWPCRMHVRTVAPCCNRLDVFRSFEDALIQPRQLRLRGNRSPQEFHIQDRTGVTEKRDIYSLTTRRCTSMDANCTSGMESHEKTDRSLIRLPISCIRPFEKSPRREPNTAHLRLKASIRQHGLDQAFS